MSCSGCSNAVTKALNKLEGKREKKTQEKDRYNYFINV